MIENVTANLSDIQKIDKFWNLDLYSMHAKLDLEPIEGNAMFFEE